MKDCKPCFRHLSWYNRILKYSFNLVYSLLYQTLVLCHHHRIEKLGEEVFDTYFISARKKVHSLEACASQLISVLGGYSIAVGYLQQLKGLVLYTKPQCNPPPSPVRLTPARLLRLNDDAPCDRRQVLPDSTHTSLSPHLLRNPG